MTKHSVFICLLLSSFIATTLQAQELQAKVTVLAQKVPSTVDKRIFTTLQTQLTNLLNNRKWTTDTYTPQERIECNFLLNINDVPEENTYKATLTVQAARPVYNASYKSALINFQDPDVLFKYIEYQPVEFNPSRVGGTDPLAANLTATFAYYVYMILGMDYDSFSPKGGVNYFQQAQNIVNNSPESRSITGWKTFDGLRNRYWLNENTINPKYNTLHDVIYGYYRTGLDQMYEDADDARENVLAALSTLQILNQQNPNLMFVQFFMQSKYNEIAGIFKKASPEVKGRAIELLSQLDVANISRYKTDLK